MDNVQKWIIILTRLLDALLMKNHIITEYNSG
jgi:hypothetical protein